MDFTLLCRSLTIAVVVVVGSFVPTPSRSQTLESGVFEAPPLVLEEITRVHRGATLNIRDGATGSLIVAGATGPTPGSATVNFTGGHANAVLALLDTFINISGSPIDGPTIGGIQAGQNVVVDIDGGKIGGIFASGNAQILLSGGVIENTLSAGPGTSVEIRGSGFQVNRVSTPSGVLNLPLLLDAPEATTVTGVFESGTPFVLSNWTGDNIDQLALVDISVPPVSLDPIEVSNGVGPVGLRPGQRLKLSDTGSLPDHFTAVDATLEIQGGMVGEGMRLANTGASFSGGALVDAILFGGTGLDVSGDVTIERLRSLAGSTVEITGGSIESAWVRQGSNLTMSAGDIGRIEPGGSLRFSGGVFGDVNNTPFVFDSFMSLLGNEFMLNGRPISGFFKLQSRNDVLTGTLADGSPFVIGYGAGDTGFDDLRINLQTIGLPVADPALIIIDGDIGPKGLRGGQALRLLSGGQLGRNFAAVEAEIEVYGGYINSNLEIVSSNLLVTGGEIGDHFSAQLGSHVVIDGGAVGNDFEAYLGSTILLESGSIGEDFRVNTGSVFSMLGGEVGTRFTVLDGGRAAIYDGVLLGDASVRAGGKFDLRGGEVQGDIHIGAGGRLHLVGGDVAGVTADPAADVNVVGQSFAIDGQPMDGLTLGETLLIVQRDVVLSGQLADGSAFSLDLSLPVFERGRPVSPGVSAEAFVTVTLVPEPYAVLGLLACVLVRRRERRRFYARVMAA